MLEKKLQKLLQEADEIRQKSIENGFTSYYGDKFDHLSNFIMKNLNSPFLKNKKAKIITNHFDEILPFIVMSNINILLLKSKLLMKQPNFKEKFIIGLKKYPYKKEIKELFYNMRSDFNSFNNFIDNDVLKTLAEFDLNSEFYSELLNRLNEENQRNFLKFLVENKCDIPYSLIEYKGNNKQMIYDNLLLYIQNARNLYSLMDFVKNNPNALFQVKEYLDHHEEKAINSIFCEISDFFKIVSLTLTDSTLKEIIKLVILDVMKNENVKFSEITYSSGSFSYVLLIGDKVIKLGDRDTKLFPNNPYIIAPLLRKEIKLNGESCFIEVTERVDTSIKPSQEELYQLYKNLRNLGLIWTDIKETNVGRLKKENVIHWKETLEPSKEVLRLQTKRGETVLKKDDFVILDADFIYDENDPNMNYSNQKARYKKFEKRYQSEKNRNEEIGERIIPNSFDETKNYDVKEQKKIHR